MSSAIHSAINASDAICGFRLGQRSTASDHTGAVRALERCGPEGLAAAGTLVRLFRHKTQAEYEPERVSGTTAKHCVEWADRIVELARRVRTSAP